MSSSFIPTTIKGVRTAPKGEQPPAKVVNVTFSADVEDDEVIVSLQSHDAPGYLELRTRRLAPTGTRQDSGFEPHGLQGVYATLSSLTRNSSANPVLCSTFSFMVAQVLLLAAMLREMSSKSVHG